MNMRRKHGRRKGAERDGGIDLNALHICEIKIKFNKTCKCIYT